MSALPEAELRALADRLVDERRFGRMRHASFSARPPSALRSYAVGTVTPMTLLRVAVEEKQRFERFRTRLRDTTAFPITQPGAFAVLVRTAERHAAWAETFASRSVRETA
ncbi:MAG TPA: hypothetical protein VI997_01370 [Candidatus Thermoplasmatota archaeon]|nr:hypothetical protein [Candidatus Thermoplasmatota archaeon]